jgi:hypothetical protein
VQFGEFSVFEAATNCYSRAMARACGSDLFEARARFQNIGVLVTLKFHPEEKALRNGCAG